MVNQPIGNHGWESFGVVRFDLGPLLQGQTRIAKLKSAYKSLFTPQPLGYCFHPWCLDGQAGGRREKICPGCISETVGTLVRMCRCATSWSDLDLTLP